MNFGFQNLRISGKADLNVISKLRRLKLFQDFTPKELIEIARIVYVRHYRKNELVFKENHPGVGMYFVDSGSVKVVKSSHIDDDRQLSILQPGQFIGELCLLNGESRTVSAIALEETCLLAIFRPDLMGLLNRKPRLGNKFLMTLIQAVTSNLRRKDEELLQMKETLSNSDIIQ